MKVNLQKEWTSAVVVFLRTPSTMLFQNTGCHSAAKYSPHGKIYRTPKKKKKNTKQKTMQATFAEGVDDASHSDVGFTPATHTGTELPHSSQRDGTVSGDDSLNRTDGGGGDVEVEAENGGGGGAVAADEQEEAYEDEATQAHSEPGSRLRDPGEESGSLAPVSQLHTDAGVDDSRLQLAEDHWTTTTSRNTQNATRLSARRTGVLGCRCSAGCACHRSRSAVARR